MRLIADLHIHSHYSRATSKKLDIPNLAIWARRKGVHIVGTGDISHPDWLAEMHENLEPAEEGLFRLCIFNWGGFEIWRHGHQRGYGIVGECCTKYR